MLHQVHRAVSRLRALFQAKELDEDLAVELDAHLSLLTEEYQRGGMTPEQARRAARLRLGGSGQLLEAHRDTRGWPLWDQLAQDIRYGARTLRREAGFAGFALLILGLGIGASAVTFSIVRTLLVQPLPLAEARRMVWLATVADDRVGEWRLQVAHFLDLQAQNRSLSEMAGYLAFYKTGGTKLTGSGEPERITSVAVAGNFFPFLRIQPLLGRQFEPAECLDNGPKAALLSHRFWTRRYAADPGIVGRTITLDEAPVTVVGVLPASFDFGSVFDPGTVIDVYQPYPLTEATSRRGNTLAVIGRLKPGISLAAAQAEFSALAVKLEAQHPERNNLRPRMTMMQEHVSGRFRPALLVLSWAVGVVMLIVCANLASLQMARAAARQRELSLRAALGASRLRLLGQTLVESLMLSGAGGLAGVAIAFAGTQALARLNSFSMPLLEYVRLDGAAIGFAAAMAMATGLIFGLAPAVRIRAHDLAGSMNEAGRGASEGHQRLWARSVLVVAEMACACMLLVGTGLLLRSFLRLMEQDLGYRPERAAALGVEMTARTGNLAQRDAWMSEVRRRVLETQGIESAGLTDVLPLNGNRSWAVIGQGQVWKQGEWPEGFVRVVSEGYFAAMGIAVKAGRDFTVRDDRNADPVIIINQSLARTLWPGEDPLGKIVLANGVYQPSRTRRVVGVVADVRHRALEQESGAEMYFPMRQTDIRPGTIVVVRTRLSEADLRSALRQALSPIEPDLATSGIRTLQSFVDKSASPQRFVVTLLSGFSLFAVLLAALGIYALIAYSVQQRTREFGVRLALGASGSELQRLVLGQTCKLAGAGVLVGAAGCVLLSGMAAKLPPNLLFGVKSEDPVAVLGIAGILLIVSLLAGFLPARRAGRADPMSALRVS